MTILKLTAYNENVLVVILEFSNFYDSDISSGPWREETGRCMADLQTIANSGPKMGSIPEIESVSTYRLDHERILEQLLDACQMNDSAASAACLNIKMH
jgi:hypothetical protein